MDYSAKFKRGLAALSAMESFPLEHPKGTWFAAVQEGKDLLHWRVIAPFCGVVCAPFSTIHFPVAHPDPAHRLDCPRSGDNLGGFRSGGGPGRRGNRRPRTRQL